MRNLLSIKIVIKTFFVFSLLFILLLRLSAQQQVYFNERIDHHNNYDYSRNIIIIDSGYMIGGFTEDSVYLYNYHLSFTGISNEGHVTSFKEYGYDTITMFLGNPGSLIQFSGNKYLTVGTKRIYTTDYVHDEGMLACYNSTFDTLWTRYYGEKALPYDTAFMFYQIKKTSNNSLIITGLRLPEYTTSRIWLLKTDSLGNKLWEHFYGGEDEDNVYFQGHSVVQTADGGYVIGGVKFIIVGTGGGTVDPLIIKTDSLGNEEWRINPGNPNVDDNKVMVALAADGNIIAGTNYGTQQSADNFYAVNKIMKITPNGQILWNYNYGEAEFDNILLNTTVLDNGNIITNGVFAQFHSGPNIISWILCVDSLGNQLWYKEYALLTGDNSFNELYDVKQTSDGGLIGCGMVNPRVPDTGNPDIWVMKMDSTGCFVAGCDTIVGVPEATAENSKFTLYPNPVEGAFTVKLEEETPQRQTFSVFNVYGIKVREIVIPTGRQSITVQTTGWPQGVYLGMLSGKKKTSTPKKFVVRR